MDLAIKKGISFGLTSGVITTLGLIVGLETVSQSKLVIIGGILSIAIADAFSDALGIHISEESQKKSVKNIWEATFATMITKFVIGLSFIVPVLAFSNLNTTRIVNVAWGFLLLTVLSYKIAQNEKKKPITVITEHISIALFVLILVYAVGKIISYYLG